MTSEEKQKIIGHTIEFVKSELRHAEGGHDWFHIERVYKTAMHIASKEADVDEVIVALGALLHDIADSKFTDGNEEIGPQKAASFLRSQKLEDSKIEAVVKIVENIGFKGGNFKQKYRSKELDIVQDADRLDALGAVGIARTFNYGGFKNRKLYDPDVRPNLEMTPSEYRQSEAPTINHFYEKLLLLKDKMNTKTGKEMAENRHRFMEVFLDQFYDEWEGRR